MTRITENIDSGFVEDDLTLRQAYNRLVAYEDIGTLQEIVALKAENERYKQITAGIPLDRLKEICEAVRLLDKTIYDESGMSWEIVKVEIYPDEVVLIDDSDNVISLKDVGEAVFLNRERAEARLKELRK